MRILPILLNLLLIANCFAGQLKPPRGMQISRGHPQSRGLVFFMPGNEGSGNKVFDLSGNGNTGVITNAPWKPAKYGSGLLFDGNDYITIADKPNLTNTTFTFSIVFKLSSLPLDSMILGAKGWTGGDREWRLVVYYGPDANDGKLRWLLGNSVGSWGVTGYYSTAALVANQWYRVTITYDGTTQRIYINGIEDSSNSSTQTLKDGSENMLIGQDGTVHDFLRATVDHSLYYNRALSAGEIAKLYANPFCMFQQDVPLMAVEAPAPPGAGQVIMITSLPVLVFGLCLWKYKAKVL